MKNTKIEIFKSMVIDIEFRGEKCELRQNKVTDDVNGTELYKYEINVKCKNSDLVAYCAQINDVDGTEFINGFRLTNKSSYLDIENGKIYYQYTLKTIESDAKILNFTSIQQTGCPHTKQK